MSWGRWAEGIEVEDPGRVSPALGRALERFLWPVVRACHRPTLEGKELLPEGPFLLVANHSAGLGIAELATFAALYHRELGPERPLAGFALPLGFKVWPVSAFLRGVGAVPSTYEAARATLQKGVPLLVFPGGDYETLRPLWEYDRVDFGGRLGFLRIAREAGVPVVPMGIRGGHFTAPILLRSKALATALVTPRLLGGKRWGLSLLGALGLAAIASAPWHWGVRLAVSHAWLGSPLSFAPWIPWTLRFRIGAALPAEELFPRGDDTELPAALARVQSAVQRLVTG